MAVNKPIGLFFGSFNPIHNGHLMIANWMVEYANLDQLWFIVSPLSPFKSSTSLLADKQRLEMVNQAIGEDARFRASDVEFNLPLPSYTIDTLNHLKLQYPDYQFVLIMGSDQLPDFHRWKNPDQILEHYRLLVYPRSYRGAGEVDDGQRDPLLDHPSVTLAKAPMMEISSTFIRNAIREGRDVRHFVPPTVWNYLSHLPKSDLWG